MGKYGHYVLWTALMSCALNLTCSSNDQRVEDFTDLSQRFKRQAPQLSQHQTWNFHPDNQAPSNAGQQSPNPRAPGGRTMMAGVNRNAASQGSNPFLPQVPGKQVTDPPYIVNTRPSWIKLRRPNALNVDPPMSVGSTMLPVVNNINTMPDTANVIGNTNSLLTSFFPEMGHRLLNIASGIPSRNAKMPGQDSSTKRLLSSNSNVPNTGNQNQGPAQNIAPLQGTPGQHRKHMINTVLPADNIGSHPPRHNHAATQVVQPSASLPDTANPPGAQITRSPLQPLPNNGHPEHAAFINAAVPHHSSQPNAADQGPMNDRSNTNTNFLQPVQQSPTVRNPNPMTNSIIQNNLTPKPVSNIGVHDRHSFTEAARRIINGMQLPKLLQSDFHPQSQIKNKARIANTAPAMDQHHGHSNVGHHSGSANKLQPSGPAASPSKPLQRGTHHASATNQHVQGSSGKEVQVPRAASQITLNSAPDRQVGQRPMQNHIPPTVLKRHKPGMGRRPRRQHGKTSPQAKPMGKRIQPGPHFPRQNRNQQLQMSGLPKQMPKADQILPGQNSVMGSSFGASQQKQTDAPFRQPQQAFPNKMKANVVPVNNNDIYRQIQGLTIKDLAASNFSREQIINALSNNLKPPANSMKQTGTNKQVNQPNTFQPTNIVPIASGNQFQRQPLQTIGNQAVSSPNIGQNSPALINNVAPQMQPQHSVIRQSPKTPISVNQFPADPTPHIMHQAGAMANHGRIQQSPSSRPAEFLANNISRTIANIGTPRSANNSPNSATMHNVQSRLAQPNLSTNTNAQGSKHTNDKVYQSPSGGVKVKHMFFPGLTDVLLPVHVTPPKAPTTIQPTIPPTVAATRRPRPTAQQIASRNGRRPGNRKMGGPPRNRWNKPRRRPNRGRGRRLRNRQRQTQTHNRRVPQKHTHRTTQMPLDTIPQRPLHGAPHRPMPTAPHKPMPTAPPMPMHASPQRPMNAVPPMPIHTTHQRSMNSATQLPMPTAPQRPMPAAPQRPMHAASQKPMHIDPNMPMHGAPQRQMHGAQPPMNLQINHNKSVQSNKQTNVTQSKQETNLNKRTINIKKETKIQTGPTQSAAANAHTNSILAQILQELQKTRTTPPPRHDINSQLGQILNLLQSKTTPVYNTAPTTVISPLPVPTTVVPLIASTTTNHTAPYPVGVNQLSPMEMLILGNVLQGGNPAGFGMLSGFAGNGLNNNTMAFPGHGNLNSTLLQTLMLFDLTNNDKNNNNQNQFGCRCFSRTFGCPGDLFPRRGRFLRGLQCKKDEVGCCDDN